MFDFDAGKFLIIGVVALIVIGPKELPRVLRQVGQMVGRVRRMASEFQGQFMDAMKEADLDSIRQDLKKIGDEAEIATHFDPARDIQRELTASLEQPASAAAVPAMAEIAAPTDGFSLQALPPAEEADQVTAAAMGVAPEVPAPDSIAPEAADRPATNGADPRPSLHKRKIRMPKRRGMALSRTHAVSDRTASMRGRPSPWRGQEVAGR